MSLTAGGVLGHSEANDSPVTADGGPTSNLFTGHPILAPGSAEGSPASRTSHTSLAGPGFGAAAAAAVFARSKAEQAERELSAMTDELRRRQKLLEKAEAEADAIVRRLLSSS